MTETSSEHKLEQQSPSYYESLRSIHTHLVTLYFCGVHKTNMTSS